MHDDADHHRLGGTDARLRDGAGRLASARAEAEVSAREVFFMLATGVLWAAIAVTLELSTVVIVVGGLLFGILGEYIYSELIGH